MTPGFAFQQRWFPGVTCASAGAAHQYRWRQIASSRSDSWVNIEMTSLKSLVLVRFLFVFRRSPVRLRKVRVTCPEFGSRDFQEFSDRPETSNRADYPSRKRRKYGRLNGIKDSTVENQPSCTACPSTGFERRQGGSQQTWRMLMSSGAGRLYCGFGLPHSSGSGGIATYL